MFKRRRWIHVELTMKYIICIVLHLSFQLPGFTQNKNLRFNHLSVQDGLSRSWVKCILEDRTGLLWIGTGDGLNKFDGKDFKIYKYFPSMPKGLNHNNINLIFEDSKGKLWIGTQAGLNYYKRELDEFVSCPSINNYVTSIYELRENTLLLGTAGGLFLFNIASNTAMQLYSNFYVEKILKDNHGNIWVATHNGLMLFNSANNTVNSFIVDSRQHYLNHQITNRGQHLATVDCRLSTVDSITLNNSLLKTIFQDSRGGLWIGTAFQGLFYLNYGKQNNTKLINFKPDTSDPSSITPGPIYAIAEDEEHNLWIGIENGGINLLSLESFDKDHYFFSKIVSNPSDFLSLSNNSIYALYRDKQNTMWVGTYAGGVDRYNKLLQRFGHHEAIPGSDKSINNKYVNAILEEEQYLWIGTERGLNRYNKATNTWEYFTHDFKGKTTIGSDAVLAIMRDSHKRLWVGTWNGGLNLFDEKSKSFLRFNHNPENKTSISNDNICKIVESKDHNIWVATSGGGVAVYNTKEGSFTSYKENPGQNALSSNWTADLIEDHFGNIWISTTEAVDMLDSNGHFTSFTHDPARPESINYNGATCIFEDSQNTIWIGTSNGINCFIRKDSSFLHYTVEDGLPNNFIKAITEDREGNIWLSTNNTLTMFKRGTTLPKNPEFRSFSVFDNMPSSEFISRSVYQNNNGQLCFGSTNGYFVFDPSHIKNNSTIPKIVFTTLKVNNIPVTINADGSPLHIDISVTKQLKLSRKQNVFTIGFASLNFIEPENNQYAFKLENFDKQWNYVGHQQSATYTNLDPGNYTFRVRASNNDGIWNEEGVSLEIIILPAWWQTWFAKVVYGILFILAVFFFRKHTIISVNLKNVLWKEHLEKQKTEELTQMKQQFFANVSHEIRTPLTLILGPLNKLIKEGTRIPELNTIFRNSTRLKMLVDQFLDFSKMESQMMTVSSTRSEILELTRYIMANFADYAGQKNIEMKLETTFSKCVAMIDHDKFEKILTNLLSNAMKSITGNGSVIVQLDFEMVFSNLVIQVIDNGCGISPEESEHIFERYYSGSSHLKSITSTGIGLYLIRELIELQKGTITVNSTLGKGSTFKVNLPILVSEFKTGHDDIRFYTHEPLAEGISNSQEDSTQKLGRTILIVDDNADMCDYMETILCDEFTIIKENNPMTCFDKIIQYLPDLIISDVMMPEMDGFQLCKLIKEDVRFSHIPVILLTAKATKNDHIAGYETGADDYIYKPFEEEILKARVKGLIVRIEKLKQHFIGYDGIIDRSIQTNSLDVKFIEEVLTEIKQNYLNPEFNVNGIIEKMGMSRSLFYKKFKSLSDQSINDLIKNFRLKKAAKMMAEGNLTVSQVAYECGFTDPAYFSRVFKEYYSITPKDFSAHSKSA